MDAKRERSHLLLEIRDEGAQVRSYRCSWGLFPQSFLPGQFSAVRLEKAPQLRASLTFSSLPGESDFLFTVKRTGEFGTSFFDLAEVGDLLALGPVGGPFALREAHLSGPIGFLGKDYCIPAFRSFVLWLIDQDFQHPLTLLHEISSREDALFSAEVSHWQNLLSLQVHYLEQVELRHLVEFRDGQLFAQAEGLDAKRYRQLFAEAGLSKERTHLERWS